MKIWIDLANSPQVLFFRPIITEFQRRGHDVTVTSRNFAQTAEIADQFGLKHTVIGGHGGKKLGKIGLRLLDRAWNLTRFARSYSFDLAVSHNSYAQAVSAFALRIPFVTTMDYEHQPANHICFRLARKVIVPEHFPEWALRKFGASAAKTARYHGLKEQVYLADFVPQSDYLASIGVPADRVVVAMRPPGSWGLYHSFENPIFEQVVEHVASHKEAFIVFLPRIAAQRQEALDRGYANVWVPPRALDGSNLLYHADLAVSGGGTMNRESAILGTPTYSVFKGKLPAVDSYLIERGRIKHITSQADIPQIQVHKKQRHECISDGNLVKEIADEMLGIRVKEKASCPTD